MKTLHELFEDGIKDMYNAEKQLTKALPKMAKMANDQRLKEGFQNHLRQTEEHARRIEQACQTLNMKPTGAVCRAMMGLVEEANEHMKGLKPSACTDAELIQLAQKVEHYEIGSYGTLCEWAKLMGHEDAELLLHQTLDEERQTDELLTQIAESEVNQQAAEESKQMGMGNGQMGGRGQRGSTKRRTTTRRSSTRSTGARGGRGRTTSTRTSGRSTSTRSSGRGTSGRSTGGHAKTGTSSRGGSSKSGTTSSRGRSRSR